MLKGRKIFITGGSSGIGLASAKIAAGYGAKVTIMGRSQQKLDAAKEELGDDCWCFSGDVTNPSDVKAAVKFAADSMGGLDGAVNSAGGSQVAPIYQLTDEQFDETVKLCLYGVMYSVREESAYMIDNNIKGSIVNISSLNSTVPYKSYTPYDSAKGGVDMLAKTACLDLAPHGIRINNVCPGFIDTPLTDLFKIFPEVVDEIMRQSPLLRWGKPEEIGESVCFLLSDKSSFTTGTTLIVDGGMQNTAYPDVFTPLFAAIAAAQESGEELPESVTSILGL